MDWSAEDRRCRLRLGAPAGGLWDGQLAVGWLLHPLDRLPGNRDDGRLHATAPPREEACTSRRSAAR